MAFELDYPGFTGYRFESIVLSKMSNYVKGIGTYLQAGHTSFADSSHQNKSITAQRFWTYSAAIT